MLEIFRCVSRGKLVGNLETFLIKIAIIFDLSTFEAALSSKQLALDLNIKRMKY